MRGSLGLLFVCIALLAPASAADKTLSSDPVALVSSLLHAPEDERDFASAKLALDKFIDPSIDEAASLAEIDAMVATVKQMLATLPADAASTSVEKLRALRVFIYEGGWWDDGWPFRYDSHDPTGQNLRSQLLPVYMATRQGNCVSMPILFLVLGERLGLNFSLSTAPLHVFVKWTDDASGETYNFEATSGGFARDGHYRKEMPMTDEAIANGAYLKTLTRREALALMASTVMFCRSPFPLSLGAPRLSLYGS
jgi:hypothetical protein